MLPKLVRRKIGSKKIEPRPRGVKSNKYEYGFMIGDGPFIAGDPLEITKTSVAPTGRSYYRKRFGSTPLNRATPRLLTEPIYDTESFMDRVDHIVKYEVKSRLMRARDAAIKEFDKVLAGE